MSETYTLWEMDGRPDGQSEEYWRQARSEVEAEERPNPATKKCLTMRRRNANRRRPPLKATR